MANTTLTRPVVTMSLANRSIGRFGLLANRVMHPLVSGRFGREIGTLTQMSDVKITPSQTGITAQTEFGETSIELPLYAKLLGKSGITEMALPKGVAADQIGDIFRAVTTISSEKAKVLIGNGVNLVITEDGKPFPVTWRQYYEYLHPPYKYGNELDIDKTCKISAITSGVLAHIGVMSLMFAIMPENTNPLTVKIFETCLIASLAFPFSFAGGAAIGALASFPITLIINQRWSILHTIRREVGRLLGFYNVDREALMFFAKGVGVNNGLSLSAFEALNNQGLSLNQLEELSSSASNPVIEEVNTHPVVLKIADEAIKSRDIKRLASLSNSPFWKVRTAVAQNPNTPEEILEILVNSDDSKEVRGAVAKNPIIISLLDTAASTNDPQILTALSTKKFPCVREQIAKNNACPSDVLEELSHCEAWRIKLAVAKNLNASITVVASVLNKIRKDIHIYQEENWEWMPEHTETIRDTMGCPDAGPETVTHPAGNYFSGFRDVEQLYYSDESIETMKSILASHPENKAKAILRTLQELNPELASKAQSA